MKERTKEFFPYSNLKAIPHAHFYRRAGACLPPLAKAKQIVFGGFRMIKPSPFTLLKNFGTAGVKPPPYGFTGDAVRIIHCMRIFLCGGGR